MPLHHSEVWWFFYGGEDIKAHHLLFQNSIDINPRNGTIKLNEKRMALIPVEAISLLRRDLISTLGMERAKGFLLRHGRACGLNDGESIEKMYDWDSKKELILAGPALHTLEGVVTVEPEILEFDESRLYMSGYWKNSFEAEEHIRHFGISKEGVCWILLGYAKGYLEKVFGKEIVIYEKSCIGKGDEVCYFVAQTAEHCKLEHRDFLRYFKEESLLTEVDHIYRLVQKMNKEKAELFDSLIEKKQDIETLLQKAKSILTVDIEKNHRIIVIKNTSPEQNEDIRLLLNDLIPTIDIFMKDGCIVLIISCELEKNMPIENFLVKVTTLIEKKFSKSIFYIGAGELANSISSLGKSYSGALRICNFLKLAYPSNSKSAIYDQLDPTIMLFLKTMEPEELLSFCKKSLGRLIEYDELNKSDLIHTLKCYLDHNGRINVTAKELNLSIPGLRYRLEKIISLSDVDIKTASFQCQIAIQIYYTIKVFDTNE